MQSEDDLMEFLKNLTESSEVEDQAEDQADFDGDRESRVRDVADGIEEPEENSGANDRICSACDTKLLDFDVKSCHLCQLQIHKGCGTYFDDDFICPICMRGNDIIASQKDCFERTKKAAEKMTSSSNKRFVPLEIGDCVSLRVPDVDQGPLDFPNILGIILDKKDDLYQIGTKNGLVKGWFPRSEIGIEHKFMNSEEVPKSVALSLREASAKQSMSGGQGFQKCNCKTGCRTKKCDCRKNNVLCNSRCHQKLSCSNKHENTEK